MSYDYASYLGYIENIDTVEDALSPFRFQYTITFKSEKTVYYFSGNQVPPKIMPPIPSTIARPLGPLEDINYNSSNLSPWIPQILNEGQLSVTTTNGIPVQNGAFYITVQPVIPKPTISPVTKQGSGE